VRHRRRRERAQRFVVDVAAGEANIDLGGLLDAQVGQLDLGAQVEAERYQAVRDNLRVKEVRLDRTPDRRWIVCHRHSATPPVSRFARVR
jgi:hypothetical protein